MENRLKPTKVLGFCKDYRVMLECLISGDFHTHLDSIGWTMSDLEFFGWDFESIQKERENYKAICQLTDSLIMALKEVIGEDSK